MFNLISVPGLGSHALLIEGGAEKYSLRHLRPSNLGSLKSALITQLKSFHLHRTTNANTHLLGGFTLPTSYRKTAVNE